MKVGISTVSVEGALAAIEAENPAWDFEKTRTQAGQGWETLLSRVKLTVSGEQKKNFYTSLYHLFLQPTTITDVDGKYRGVNDSVFVSGAGGRDDTDFDQPSLGTGVSAYLDSVGKGELLHDW